MLPSQSVLGYGGVPVTPPTWGSLGSPTGRTLNVGTPVVSAIEKKTYTAPVAANDSGIHADPGDFYQFTSGGKTYYYAPSGYLGDIAYNRNAHDVQRSDVPSVDAPAFFSELFKSIVPIKPKEAGGSTGGTAPSSTPSLDAIVRQTFGLTVTQSSGTDYGGAHDTALSIAGGRVYESDPTAHLTGIPVSSTSNWSNYWEGLVNVLLGVAGGVGAAYLGGAEAAGGGIAAQGGSQGAAIGGTQAVSSGIGYGAGQGLSVGSSGVGLTGSASPGLSTLSTGSSLGLSPGLAGASFDAALGASSAAPSLLDSLKGLKTAAEVARNATATVTTAAKIFGAGAAPAEQQSAVKVFSLAGNTPMPTSSNVYPLRANIAPTDAPPATNGSAPTWLWLLLAGGALYFMTKG